jgi:RNA polymerase sigma-70 factor, ECF subfamily
MTTRIPGEEDAAAIHDEWLVERILAGETELYEIIIRRYNSRLYRISRAILHDGAEAEDVVQETYVRAYEHLPQFAGRSLFSTWLTRIAVHEAWHRMEQQRRQADIDSTEASFGTGLTVNHTAEHQLLAMETHTLLEQAIDGLPDSLRPVFAMRSLENMTTAETSKCLDITEAAVKERLLRARHILRRVLYELAHATASSDFTFLGERCDRITRNVIFRIAQMPRWTQAGSAGPSTPARPRERVGIAQDPLFLVNLNPDRGRHRSG